MLRSVIGLLVMPLAIGVPFARAEEAPDPQRAPAVISALAGFITFVDGDSELDGQAVDPAAGEKYQLGDGERLVTGQGRAELTLNIASYLRIGPHSEVEMLRAGFAAAQLRLYFGVVIADVGPLIDGETSSVSVGESEIRFEKPGQYRISVDDP